MNYYTGIYWRYRSILEYGQGLTVPAVLEVVCLSAQWPSSSAMVAARL